MWVAALLTASCTPALKVEVANTTPTERDDETVEIAWSEVAALKGVTPDNIVVLNDDNEQIPSQVLFRGGTEPQALIFQTDADPMESKRFKLVTGQRENYPASVRPHGSRTLRRLRLGEQQGGLPPLRPGARNLSRETRHSGHRRMGEVHRQTGDRRVVRPGQLPPQLRRRHGLLQGGRDARFGASLPFAGGKFWMMGHNYATARTLDNGPTALRSN